MSFFDDPLGVIGGNFESLYNNLTGVKGEVDKFIKDLPKNTGKVIDDFTGQTEINEAKLEAALGAAEFNIKQAGEKATEAERRALRESVSYQVQARTQLDAGRVGLANVGVSTRGSASRRAALSQANVSTDIAGMLEDTSIAAQALKEQAEFDRAYTEETGELAIREGNISTGFSAIGLGFNLGASILRL